MEPEIPEMVRFVVVALPFSVSPPNVGALVVPMFWGRLKLMMFGEPVATVIWFAVPWIWNVDVARPLILIALKPVPVMVIVFGVDVETVTVPAPTIDVVLFVRPLIDEMPVLTAAGTQKVPFQVRT